MGEGKIGRTHKLSGSALFVGS